MKFREICRFEILNQAQSVRTWFCAAVLFAVAYLLTGNAIGDARTGGPLVTSPYNVAATTVIANVLWVLFATAVAGTAAARDAETRMHPLVYTTPVTKADYLGGRFLAAFILNAVILLAVPAGMLLALLVSGPDLEIRGPFRPGVYLSTYVFMALPTAFAVAAIQFSLAVLSRRAVASYLGSVLVIAASIVAGVVVNLLNMPTLGTLLDPIGFITVVGLLSKTWTLIEKNTILIGLEGATIANAGLWVGVGLSAIALAGLRFRLGDRAAGLKSRRATRRRNAQYAQ